MAGWCLRSAWLSSSRAVWRLASRQSERAGRRGVCNVRLLSTSVWLCGEDQITHTGQQWESSDYRNVRFVDREKQVNEQFAISLLAEEPVVVVQGTHTWCNGGRGALGHPKIYINLDKPEINDCGYCGKRFVAAKNKDLFPTEKFTA